MLQVIFGSVLVTACLQLCACSSSTASVADSASTAAIIEGADESNEVAADVPFSYSTEDVLSLEVAELAAGVAPELTSRKFLVRRMKKGENIRLWRGVNVNGKVYYKIGNRSGTDRLKLWWVNRPIGSIDRVGFRQDSGEVKIPRGFLKTINDLKAGHADSDTVIYISEDIKIATNFPPIRFP
jgi:hypothetical protein